MRLIDAETGREVGEVSGNYNPDIMHYAVASCYAEGKIAILRGFDPSLVGRELMAYDLERVA